MNLQFNSSENSYPASFGFDKYLFWLAISALFTLPVTAQININFSSTSPTCSNYTNGSISAQVTGGQSPYQYLWSTGSQANTIYVGAGTYNLIVSDANGLTMAASYTLEAPAPIVVEVDPVNSVCEGTNGSYVANVSGGTAPYTYHWSTGDTDNQVDQPGFGYLAVTVTDANGCMKVGGRNIRESMTVSVHTVDVVCAALCDGSAEAIITGGYGPYTFAWSNGGNTQVIFPLPPGTYTVTVTDAYGCSVSATGSISEPPPINVTFDVQNPCTGSATVTANATGGTPPFTYEWSNGMSGATITGVSQGVYFVTATDANLCKKTANVTVSSGNINITAITNPATCNGLNDGTATIYVSGGIGPYTYTWNGGLTGNLQQNLSAGNYSVTVADATGCSGTTAFEITNSQSVNIALTTTGDGCSIGNTGSATAVVTGGTSPYTFHWSGSTDNDPFINGLGTGNYSLTVTDAIGCISASNFNIEDVQLLNIEIIASATSCAGADNGSVFATASGGIQPYVFNWSNNAGNTPALSDLSAGNYSVTVTDAMGCVQNQSFQINQGAQSIGIDLATTESGCNNINSGTVIATISGGTAPYTYNWSNSSVNNNNLTNLAPGAFTVTVTDTNGCAGTSSGVIAQASAFTLSLNSVNTSCNNIADGSASVTINGIAPDAQYQWSNSNTSASINGLGTGTYDVTVSSSNGCTATGSVNVEPAVTLSLNLTSVESGCNNANNGSATVVISGGAMPYTILWDDQSNQATETANNLAPGMYNVNVQEASGCIATADIEVPVAMPFSLSAAVDDASCQNIADGAATISVVGNYMSPLNVAWSTSDDELQINNLLAGDYQVTVTDANNCSAQTSVSINSGTGVALNINALQENQCLGTGAPLSVTTNPADNLTYSWSAVNAAINNASSPTPDIVFNNTGVAIIQLTATNQDGCIGSDEITVNVNDTIFNFEPALVVVNQDCNDYNVSFNNTNSSGVTYTWIFGDPANPLGTSVDQNPVFTFPGSGQQQITVVPDADCMSPVAFMIDLTPPSQAAFSYALNDCSETVTLGFTDNSSVTPTSWNWNFGALGNSTVQNPSLEISTSQIFDAQLIATFPNGCTDTINQSVPVVVFQPALPPTDLNACAGNAVGINPDGNPDLNYLWSPGGSTEVNPSVSVTANTTYSVTITDNNGCHIEAEVNLNVPPPVELLVSNDINACDSAPTTIQATSNNATSFAWSNEPDFTPVLGQSASLEVVPGIPATYYVLASDEFGCTNNAAVEVGLYALEYLLSPDDTICSGRSADISFQNLNPDQTLSLGWAPFDPTTMPVTLTNEFTLTITNQYGCSEAAAVAVEVMDMELVIDAIAEPDTIKKGEISQIASTFNDKYTYQWSPIQFLDDPTVSNPVAKPEETTTYCVTITNDLGCEAVRCVTIVVVTPPCQEPNLYFPNAFTPDGDGLNDVLYLYGSQVTDVHFVIYNRWGEKVFESNDQADGWDGTYRSQPVAPDAYGYYLEVKCAGGDEFFKKGNVTVLK